MLSHWDRVGANLVLSASRRMGLALGHMADECIRMGNDSIPWQGDVTLLQGFFTVKVLLEANKEGRILIWLVLFYEDGERSLI